MIEIPEHSEFIKIKKLCNQYLEQLKQDRELWPDCMSDSINWGDLKCVDVLFCVNDFYNYYWNVFVDEVEPEAVNLHAYLKYCYEQDGLEEVKITTEW